jgi:cell division protein FtsQ
MLKFFKFKQPKVSRTSRDSSRASVYLPSLKFFFRSCLLGIFILVIYVIFFISHSVFFPITQVSIIDARHRIDPIVLEERLSQDIKTGFFKVDLKKIHEDLLSFPWVKNVKIARRWPNTLLITIEEHEPMAVWNQESLIDKEGEVFTPEKVTKFSDLPQFMGSSEALPMMVKYYSTFEKLLLPINLHMTRIVVSRYAEWSITLNDGLVIYLGNELVDKRLQRFVKIYDTIFSSSNRNAKYVDMRYSNAMVVRWRENE